MNENKLNPLISVIIPTYNKSYVIENTIKCVLSQTWKKIEILIINDASTDNTNLILEKLNNPRIKVYTNKNNLGVCHSRQIGIKKSTSKFICFLDDDDDWSPDHIENLIKTMQRTQSQITISNYKTNINGQLKEYYMHKFCDDFKKEILNRQGPFLQCCLFKKNIFSNNISFDKLATPCEDWDLFIQISKGDYVISHSNHIGFTWNFTQNSQSSNLTNEVKALEYIVDKNKQLIINTCGMKILSNHYRFIARVYEKIKNFDMATVKYKEAFFLSKTYYKNIFYIIFLFGNMNINYKIINFLRKVRAII